jgi:parallel beta-helix repeat protein
MSIKTISNHVAVAEKSRVAVILSLLMLSSTLISGVISDIGRSQGPIVQFSVDVVEGSIPLTVNFTFSCTSNSGDCDEYTMDFDDLSEDNIDQYSGSNSITIEHTYNSPGIIRPNVTFVDNQGQESSQEVVIIAESDYTQFKEARVILDGVDLGSLRVGTPYGWVEVEENGSADIMVNRDDMTSVAAWHEDRALDDLNTYFSTTSPFSVRQSGPIVIDHISTAHALLYSHPALFVVTPWEHALLERVMNQVPEVMEFANILDSTFKVTSDPYEVEEFNESFELAVNQTLSHASNNIKNANGGLPSIFSEVPSQNLGTLCKGHYNGSDELDIRSHALDGINEVELSCAGAITDGSLHSYRQGDRISGDVDLGVPVDYVLSLREIDLMANQSIAKYDNQPVRTAFPAWEGAGIGTMASYSGSETRQLLSMEDVRNANTQSYGDISHFDLFEGEENPSDFQGHNKLLEELLDIFNSTDNSEIISTQFASGKPMGSLSSYLSPGSLGYQKFSDALWKNYVNGAEATGSLHLPENATDSIYIIRAHSGILGAPEGGWEKGEYTFAYQNHSLEWVVANWINILHLALESFKLVMGKVTKKIQKDASPTFSSEGEEMLFGAASALQGSCWNKILDGSFSLAQKKLREIIMEEMGSGVSEEWEDEILWEVKTFIFNVARQCAAAGHLSMASKMVADTFAPMDKLSKGIGYLKMVADLHALSSRALTLMGTGSPFDPGTWMVTPMNSHLLIVGDPFRPKITHVNGNSIDGITPGNLSSLIAVHMGDNITLRGKSFKLAEADNPLVWFTDQANNKLYPENGPKVPVTTFPDGTQEMVVTLPETGLAGRVSIVIQRLVPSDSANTVNWGHDLPLLAIIPEIHSIEFRNSFPGEEITIKGRGLHLEGTTDKSGQIGSIDGYNGTLSFAPHDRLSDTQLVLYDTGWGDVSQCGMKSFNLSWENLPQFHTFGTFRILCTPEVVKIKSEPVIPDSVAIIQSLNGGDIGLRGTTDHVTITYRQEAYSYTGANSTACPDEDWDNTPGRANPAVNNQTLRVRWIVSEDENANITDQLTDDLNSSIAVLIPVISIHQSSMQLHYLPRGCNWTVSPTATIWITTPSGTSPGYTFNLSIDAEPEWRRSIVVGHYPLANMSFAVRLANWEASAVAQIDHNLTVNWVQNENGVWGCQFDWPFPYLSSPPGYYSNDSINCPPQNGIKNWAWFGNGSTVARTFLDTIYVGGTTGFNDTTGLFQGGPTQINSSGNVLRGPWVVVNMGQVHEAIGGGLLLGGLPDGARNHIQIQFGGSQPFQNGTGDVLTLYGVNGVMIHGLIRGTGCDRGLVIRNSGNVSIGSNVPIESYDCANHVTLVNSTNVTLIATKLSGHANSAVNITGGGSNELILTNVSGLTNSTGIILQDTSFNRIYAKEVANHGQGIVLGQGANNNTVAVHLLQYNTVGLNVTFDAEWNVFGPPILYTLSRDEAWQPPLFLPFGSILYVNDSKVTFNDVGIRIMGGQYNLIHECLIEQNRVGIEFGLSAIPWQINQNLNNTIQNNTISENTEYGMMIHNVYRRNLVEDNEFSSNGLRGIRANSSSDFVIRNNSFQDEKIAIHISNSSEYKIVQFSINNSSDEGIRISNSFEIVIGNGVIENGSSTGIHLISTQDITLSLLIIRNNDGHGIDIEQRFPNNPFGRIRLHGFVDGRVEMIERQDEWSAMVHPSVDKPNEDARTELEIYDNQGKGIWIHDNAPRVDFDLVNIYRNDEEGVHISDTEPVTITRSKIGFNPDGSAGGNGIGDPHSGILIESQDRPVTIGGINGLGNLIANNGKWGIEIIDSNNVAILGNWIGVSQNGNAQRANIEGGIYVIDSNSVHIGNAVPFGKKLSGGNLISGHFAWPKQSPGILIEGDSKDQLIRENFIGTDLTGTVALPNSIGVQVSSTPSGNPQVRLNSNLISGNEFDGVSLEGVTNTFLGRNIIGRSILAGVGVPNAGVGVDINTCTSLTLQFNTISWNQGPQGLNIQDCSQLSIDTNSIESNSGVGIQASDVLISIFIRNKIASNNGDGLILTQQSSDNQIIRNVINMNSGSGIIVEDQSVSNTISVNSITNNDGEGISLSDGGNREIRPPVIGFVDVHAHDPTQATIFGIIDYAVPEGSNVEIFADNDEEGEVFIGSAISMVINSSLLNLSNMLGVALENLPGNISMPTNYSHIFMLESARAAFPVANIGDDLSNFNDFTVTITSATTFDTSEFGFESAAFNYTNLSEMPPTIENSGIHTLEITAPADTPVTIDNERTITVGENGHVIVRLRGGVHNVSVPETMSIDSNQLERYVFAEWRDLSSSNILQITILDDISIEAVYSLEDITYTLDSCTIQPNSLSINIGDVIQLASKGWNGSVEIATDDTIWSTTGNIGTISENGTFTVTNAGNGSIEAALTLQNQIVSCVISIIALDPGSPPVDDDDDDGDGVPNEDDLCPNTSVGDTVDSTGCSVVEPSPNDDDGDGVPNEDDLCPNTSVGDTVDSTGCTVVEPDIFGCMDENAINYNEEATKDDGKCQGKVSPRASEVDEGNGTWPTPEMIVAAVAAFVVLLLVPIIIVLRNKRMSERRIR